jgi:hypothetical protein
MRQFWAWNHQRTLGVKKKDDLHGMVIVVEVPMFSRVGRIVSYTCPHNKNIEIGNFLFLEFRIFSFKSIKLVCYNSFFINKNKNRGKFLSILPHPSSNGMSIWVNFPWAIFYKQRCQDWQTTKNIHSKRIQL